MKSFEQIARSMRDAATLELQRLIGVMQPDWEKVGPVEKQCWIEAAKTAHKEITEVH